MARWLLADFLEPVWTGPDEFLSRYRDQFPDLRSFAGSLDDFTESLKADLTTIIHDDYTEFVSISKQLLQLGESMTTLVRTLRVCEQDIADAARSREAATQTMRSRLESVQKVKHEYAVCSLALDAFENLESVESRLSEVSEDIYSFMDVAIGLSVTQAKIHALDQPSERNPVQGEFDRLHANFCDAVTKSFCDFVKNGSRQELEVILNAVAVTGIYDVIYEAYSTCFLGGLVDAMDKQLRGIRGARANCDVLFSLALEYLQASDNELAFVDEVCGESMDFMESAFWPNVVAFMDKRISFPIGNVAEQKKGFASWMEFLSACEAKCKTAEAVASIRESAECKSIQGKVGLNVYAQLVSKQICSEAETAFNEELKATASDEFSLNICGKFVRCYERLFSEELFVAEQAKDFVITGMKLVASLAAFAKTSGMQYKPLFAVDLAIVSESLRRVTPVFLRTAMQKALSCLPETAKLLRQQLTTDIADKCCEQLAYLDRLTLVGLQNQKSTSASPHVTAAMNTYLQWAARDGSSIADADLLQEVVDRMLISFFSRVDSTLKTLKNDLEMIAKFRKTTSGEKDSGGFNLDALKEKIYVDFEYIANITRGKSVPVDSMASFRAVADLLRPEAGA